MELYQIIFQDEYNNLYELGYYTDLKEAVKDINDLELNSYDVQLQPEDLHVYAGSFSPVIDLDLGMLFEDNDSIQGCYIRGFVKDLDSELKTLQDLKHKQMG